MAHLDRQTALETLKGNPDVDVLIIGGGINGIGTFRDLALQGVRVLLAEKGDFCSGASAASSHMLHGGIRYLENAEFRLVREALHERNLMLKNAPHYAKPNPTTIPMFRWFSGMLNAPLKFLGLMDRPAERGGIIIKMGLMMYDAFTGPQQSMPFHTFRMELESLKTYPHLNKDIVSTATYYDAWMPYPERICIDLLDDAHKASDDVMALNYLRASDGAGDTVTLTDELTGENYEVKPKVVINAAGPWIDFVNKAMDQPTRFIGGTKGSHLMLDNPELHEACNGTEFFFENHDGRIVLIFPFLNRVMVGTTDIRIENPEEAVTSEEEIDYILGMIPKVFPDIEIDRSQIVYHFSGVRPLPASDGGSTGTISRDHSIKTVEPGKGLNFKTHSLVGGKWTSFRAFSEEATDVALKDINKPRQMSTEAVAIGGGKDFPTTDTAREEWIQQTQQQTEVAPEHLSILLDRYGTRAADVAAYLSEANDAALEHVPDYTRREVEYITQTEQVIHIDDFLQRRSLIAMLGYATPPAVQEIGMIIGTTLGWSEAQTQTEIDRTLTILRERHGLAAEMA